MDDFYASVGTDVRGRNLASASVPQPMMPGDVAQTAISDGPGNPAPQASGAQRWAENHGIFWGASSTYEELPPGLYRCGEAPNIGPILIKQSVDVDNLMVLPDNEAESVLEEFERFWKLEDKFRSRGFLLKRGMLLWGAPGSGKTSAINLMMRHLIDNKNGIVVFVDHPMLAAQCLRLARRIEPKRPMIVVMEDLDALTERHGEHEFLALLDGEAQIDNVIYVACHSPDTRILTADLRWVPASEIKAGDEIWALDEHRSERTTATGRESSRRYRRAQVVSSFLAQKECVRVYLDTGESFVCSTDHPWLSKGSEDRSGMNLEWTQAKDLLLRPNLCRPFLPWEPLTTWEAGWFAGMLDGEGHVRKGREGRSSSVGMNQVIGPTAEMMVEVAQKFGEFEVDLIEQPNPRHQNQVQIRALGGAAGAAAILGQVRPPRLLSKFTLEGGIVQCKHPAKVVHVEPMGMADVQSIETTAKTYFAEGFAVHNTTNYPERLDPRFVDRPSRFDTIREICMPSKAARRAYFANKEPSLTDCELDEWVRLSEGLSVAHLKEMIIAVRCFGQPLGEVTERLSNMKVRPSSERGANRRETGFGLARIMHEQACASRFAKGWSEG